MEENQMSEDELIVNTRDKDKFQKKTEEVRPIQVSIASGFNSDYFLEWKNINYVIKDQQGKKVKVGDVIPNKYDIHSQENSAYPSSFSKESRLAAEVELLGNKVNSKDRVILNDISGFAAPREILVIMGPSGSGKTSLLNTIADRQLPTNRKKHVINREVYVNDLKVDKSYGMLFAYIMQDDVLLDTLTPKELLLFSARLKLKVSYYKALHKVEELINQLGLQKCADTMIGNAFSRGVSGGERKRTSIAYELISDPSIIIIDEPTTGMDSFTSLTILKLLKNLASQQNKTIICTIHQPSSEIFELIDRIILLKDGNLVYQGHKLNALDYFSSMNLHMPEFYNPFDFFIEVMSDSQEKTNETLFTNYLTRKNPENKLESLEIKERLNFPDSDYFNELIETREKNKRVSWFLEFWILLGRSMKNYYRNKSVFYAKLFQYCINTLILFFFYRNIGLPENSDTLYINFLGFFYNNCNNFFINGIMYTLYTIPALKALLRRECAAKLYRMSAFYVSLFVTLLVPALLYSIIFSFLLFEGLKLKKDLETFIVFFSMNIFIYTTGSVYGLMFGAIIHEKIIITVAPFVATLFSLGSGFYKSNDDFSSAFEWVNSISPYRYFLEIQMGNQSDFNDITDKILALNGYKSGVEFCLIYLFSTFAGVFIIGYFCFVLYSKKF